MVDDLVLGKARHGRQHAEAVAREQDDVVRVAADGGQLGVGDVLQRVGAAGVLRDRDVVEVDLAILRVEDDILDDRAEADRVEDLRLAFGGERDALGVAAALDVEDALVRPDMLVVADEVAPRVGREGRLARAGEAEEDRHAAVGPLVGRGVETELLAQRHLVHHQREDALLHLASVLRAQDDHLRLRGRARGEVRMRSRSREGAG